MEVCTKQKETEVPHDALIMSDALVLRCVKASCIMYYFLLHTWTNSLKRGKQNRSSHIFCVCIFVQIWKVTLGLNVVPPDLCGLNFYNFNIYVCSISVFQDACVWVFDFPYFHSLSLLHLLNFDLNLCIICWKHISTLNSTFTKNGIRVRL